MKYINIPSEDKKIYVAKSEIKSVVMQQKGEAYHVDILIGQSVLTKTFKTYEEAEKFTGDILTKIEE